MAEPLTFTVTVSTPERFSTVGDAPASVTSIVDVTADRVPEAATATGSSTAEVVIIDNSGSMHGEKIAAARDAAAAAVDALETGSYFAVVAGSTGAVMVYPQTSSLARVTDASRSAAKRAIAAVLATGGTRIGVWLDRARQLFETRDCRMCHVILLTDGQNGESRTFLDQVLDRCAGRFVCDPCGIGEGWDVAELRHVATALRGRSDAIEAVSELPTVFRDMIREAREKVVPDLTLDILLTPPVELRSLWQEYPDKVDMTAHLRRESERRVALDTGAWGEQTRHYRVVLGVSGLDSDVGEPLCLARVKLTAGRRELTPFHPVVSARVDDPTLTTAMSEYAESYLRQDHLRSVMLRGAQALDAGDEATALALLTEAVRLARVDHDDIALVELQTVVAIDPGTGVVRLRPDLGPKSTDILRLRSTRSSIVHLGDLPPLSTVGEDRAGGDGARHPDGPPRGCPSCDWLSPPDARFCMRCRFAFDGPTPPPATPEATR